MAETRVLVLEDEPSARDLLVTILEDDGYRVCAVAEGLAALEAAESFHPNLALIDGGLPGIKGSEVARRLRQAGDLPIIFVTAADAAEDIRGAFRMGADDYIVKPFDPEELVARVKWLLQSSKEALAERREAELQKAELLDRLEAAFNRSRQGAAGGGTATLVRH